MNPKTEIRITDEFISIEYDGVVIVFWEAQEWCEDDTIVPSIANVIMLAASDRMLELMDLVGKIVHKF
jgi:hypothetical protein